MNDLYTKQGKSVAQLARLLLQTTPETRLPAMPTLALEQGTSVGTVQAAMQYLQASQCVTIDNRGRSGAFVQALDYPRLWELAHQRPMTAMLPMPYSRRLEGLATGLRATFDTHNFDVALRFVRGATARMQHLHTQACDWVVTSRYAAESASAHGFTVAVAVALGEATYTVDHVLVTREHHTLQAGMRVGIDSHSADHAMVVRRLCRGVPVTLVEIDYSTSLKQLSSGEIDATVWVKQDLPLLPEQFHIVPIDRNNFEDNQLEQLGEAVIVTLPDAVAVQHLLHATLDADHLGAIQSDVLTGRRRPTY